MTLSTIEDSLANLYKDLPHLPTNGRKTLVQWVPWINLVIGVLTLWTAWILWSWAHTVNNLSTYYNSISQSFGVPTPLHRLDVGIWLGLIVLIIEGAMLLGAFVPTKEHKKNGWDLMFYAALINIVYALVLVFTDYGGFTHLIGEIIASLVGLYFLFEIRSYYKGQTKSTKKVES